MATIIELRCVCLSCGFERCSLIGSLIFVETIMVPCSHFAPWMACLLAVVRHLQKAFQRAQVIGILTFVTEVFALHLLLAHAFRVCVWGGGPP